MKSILMENNNVDKWGCNLLPDKSEEKEWCESIKFKIKYKFSIIQDEIDRVAEFLKLEGNEDLIDNIKFFKEDDPFFSENLKNLVLLESLLVTTCPKAKESIETFKNDLANKYLFVEKQNNKFVYSQLNKLNTNYSALAFLITNFRTRHKLTGKTFDEVFNLFFRRNPPSYDESKFFNLLIYYFSGNEKAKEIFDQVFKSIKGTDSLGKKTEDQAFKYLNEFFDAENIKLFAGDYSWVDFLGVDALIFDNDFGWGWVPVQIKTSIRDCKGNYRFCKNMCIGRDDKKNWNILLYDGKQIINTSEI